MSWAIVGNPGNLPDTSGLGTVTDTYRIAKEEVTNAQYAEFLNVVDPAGVNPNGLYNNLMGSNVRGGISFTPGNPVGSKYASRINMGNKPAVYVSWFDAARFANWMHNGQGTGGTEIGAYDMTISTPIRLAGATVFLPSENEWYKAAYYDPRGAAAAGPPRDNNYWLYPTQSDNRPVLGSASAIGDISNSGANVANYNRSADWNGQNGNVTSVGTAMSSSFYGAFDLAGNAYEWNEGVFNEWPFTEARGVSGGWFGSDASALESTQRHFGMPESEGFSIGFRIASIPEPTAVGLLLITLVKFGYRRRRSPRRPES
ncbi:MAG: SUMF1/EgtB/PvdO family nonheme iron enzyme [Verrucomicrobiales bacterium]